MTTTKKQLTRLIAAICACFPSMSVAAATAMIRQHREGCEDALIAHEIRDGLRQAIADRHRLQTPVVATVKAGTVVDLTGIPVNDAVDTIDRLEQSPHIRRPVRIHGALPPFDVKHRTVSLRCEVTLKREAAALEHVMRLATVDIAHGRRQWNDLIAGAASECLHERNGVDDDGEWSDAANREQWEDEIARAEAE